ncbi:hypothetical protein FRC17_002212 [Serendipita sp. 399]|nr:hypothetical protein FRC17_002212 [Serendipita sp. 399]
MFKKDFKNLKNRVPLRNSEILALRRGIASRFALSEEDATLLVPSGLLSAKFITHLDVSGTVLFDSEGTPIWFQSGAGRLAPAELVPTVYTLWKRVFLPIFTTPQMVIDKLRDGADLMAPGIISIRSSYARSLPMEVGEIVCIAAYSQDGNQPPVAVGQLGMSTQKIEETGKGKAVLTLQTYGDTLWQKGSKQDPPQEFVVLGPTQPLPENGPNPPVISTKDDEPQSNDEGGPSQGNDTLSNQEAPQTESADVLTPSDVDQILRNALLYYLHANSDSISFPYSASVLYADGILPFRPSDVNISESVIKNSSYKKLKPFLKSIEKDGILKLKEIGGELAIMAIDHQHPGVQGVRKYRTFADEEKREAKARAIEETQAANAKVMTIVELYKPIGSAVSLFKAIHASTTSHYSITQLRDDILSRYIAEHSLAHPVERGYFKVDDTLKGALLKKSESEEFLRRDDGLQRLAGTCQSWYEIKQEGRAPELRKGKLSPISVVIKTRQGRRAVTLITNFEPFFLVADQLSEELRKLCAAQTSGGYYWITLSLFVDTFDMFAVGSAVSPVLGKPNQTEVLVQGKQGKAVMDYLLDHGVPKKWIEVDDTTEKKKAGAPLAVERELPKERLPIYPTDSPKPEVVEVPTQLESNIRKTREIVTEAYGVGRSRVQTVIDRWIGVEHAVETRLKSLSPPADVEPLFPGALWVGVAMLSGSIFSRGRRISRIIRPPLWGLVAAAFFLPNHTRNVGNYIFELEERYIPAVAKRQQELAANGKRGLESSKDGVQRLRGELDVQMGKVTDFVRSTTGLKLDRKPQDSEKK